MGQHLPGITHTVSPLSRHVGQRRPGTFGVVSFKSLEMKGMCKLTGILLVGLISIGWDLMGGVKIWRLCCILRGESKHVRYRYSKGWSK